MAAQTLGTRLAGPLNAHKKNLLKQRPPIDNTPDATAAKVPFASHPSLWAGCSTLTKDGEEREIRLAACSVLPEHHAAAKLRQAQNSDFFECVSSLFNR